MMPKIRKYLSRRTDSMRLEQVFFKGKNIVKTADRLGKKLKKKQISQESDEIVSMIEKCNEIKYNELADLLMQLKQTYKIELPIEQLEQIDRLQITRLYDCRTFGEKLEALGLIIKNQKENNFWMNRFPIYSRNVVLTNIEACSATILLTLSIIISLYVI